MNLQERIATMASAILIAEFNEEDHPRDDHGRFATGELHETDKVKWSKNDYDPSETLNGKPLSAVDAPDFDKGVDPNLREPAFPKMEKWQHAAAGVIMIEPGNKTFIVAPQNYFGGYRNTFSKGTAKEGESLQKAAVREVYEETGLLAKITGYLGDVKRSSSVTRYYTGERIGGSPALSGRETHAVKLVSIDDPKLPDRLSMKPGKTTADHKVLALLKSKLGIAAAAGVLWDIRDAAKLKAAKELFAAIPDTLKAQVRQVCMSDDLGARHGMFDAGTVYLNPDIFLNQHKYGQQKAVSVLEHVLANECAHGLYEALPKDKRKAWRALSGWQKGQPDGNDPPYVEKRPGWPKYTAGETHSKDAKFPNVYSAKNAREDFSDCAAYCTTGNEAQVPEAKRKFIHDLLGKKEVCASCESGDCVLHAGGPGSGRKKSVFYHGTPTKNIDSIMKTGLQPNRNRIGKSAGHVYLSKVAPTAHYFGNSGSAGEGYTVLKVELPDSEMGKVERDPIHPFNEDKAYRYKGTIDPQHLSVSSLNPSKLGTTSPDDFAEMKAGGPGSGPHGGLKIPKLHIGQRGVGKDQGAVFPAHGRGSELPGRHQPSFGKYTKTEKNKWTAVGNMKNGNAWRFDVQKSKNSNGTVRVTRFTTYDQHPTADGNPKQVSQAAETSIHPSEHMADSFLQKRFGIAASRRLTQAEDRIRAFTIDRLQADFDESLHPRGPGGKFVETGGPKLTPQNKFMKLQQMGFKFKGAFADAAGKYIKDVFTHPNLPHEVHVTKYNTTHPGNADLRKFAVVNPQTGKVIQQGHQISKVQDFVNKQPASAVPVAKPAQPADKEPSFSTGFEKQGLKEAGFKYVGSGDSKDLYQHPSGVSVKVGSTTTIYDKSGKQIGEVALAAPQGVISPQIATAIKDAQQPPAAPKQGMSGATHTSPSEANALIDNGFGFKGQDGENNDDIWKHNASGTLVHVDDNGFVVYPGNGAAPKEGTNVDNPVGGLHPAIKEAISQPKPGPVSIVQPKSSAGPNDKATSPAEQKTLTDAGFSHVSSAPGKDEDLWQHPSGVQVVTNPDGYKVTDKSGKEVGSGHTAYETIGKLDKPIADAVANQSVQTIQKSGASANPPQKDAYGNHANTWNSAVQILTNQGFSHTATTGTVDTWTHPSGVTVDYSKTKPGGESQVTVKNSTGNKVAGWLGLTGKTNELTDIVKQEGVKPAAPAQQPASAKTITPAPVGVEPGKTGSIAQEKLKGVGFTFTGKGAFGSDIWQHPSGVQVWRTQTGVSIGKIGQTYSSATKYNGSVGGNLNHIKDAILSATGQAKPIPVAAPKPPAPPPDHPTKAAGPQIPASGKNTALTDAGYQFQKNENGFDYWSKPGSDYGAVIKPTDPTHSTYTITDKSGKETAFTGKMAGDMISKLNELNGPKQATPTAPASKPAPAAPAKEWTTKAWQQKAQQTIADLWKNTSAADKQYGGSSVPASNIYKKAADALGVPFSKVEEVAQKIGSWQGGTTANDGNKIGDWAQQIVNGKDQVHPGLYIEYQITQQRIKDTGGVPTLWRGLSASGDPHQAGQQPTMANVALLKGIAKMSGDDFAVNFPTYGAEGYTSEPGLYFGSGGVKLEKPAGTIPPEWVMSARDLNKGMWPGYAGEHEWMIACPNAKMKLDSSKGDKLILAMTEEVENKLFALLHQLKESGWDYQITGKEILIIPPAWLSHGQWLDEMHAYNLARHSMDKVAASEEKPLRRIFIGGLPPIDIEWEMGQTRTGTSVDGKAWSQVMPYAYGRFAGTKGLDGEHVDCIIGRNPRAKQVYVACVPKNLGNEEKIMVGFDSLHAAKIAFLACYGYQQKYLQTISVLSKPLLMTLMKVKDGKSAIVKQPIDAMSPPGFGGTTRKMAEDHPEIENPYGLAWSMYKKGAHSHIKAPNGTGAKTVSPKVRKARHKALKRKKHIKADWAKWNEEHPYEPKGRTLKKAEADRTQWPQHIQDLKLPPAWKEIHYSEDPKSALQAIGKDAKGRDQYVYSKEFQNSQAALKFERIAALEQEMIGIDKQLEADRNSTDPTTKDHADVMSLIRSTGLRPGSEDDTGAKKQAYGATTLEGRHVRVSTTGNVRLQFTGKKGVDLNLPVDDPKLAQMLVDRKQAAGNKGQIFPTVSDSSLRDYAHQNLDHGGFKVKDFRTFLGTSMAQGLVGAQKAPTNEKEYKKAVRNVAKQVSAKLGNTPAVALSSYIAPQIFLGWKQAAGVIAAAQQLPEVHYGEVTDKKRDFRDYEDKFDARDDDAQRPAKSSVKKMLGFDPAEIAAEYSQSTTGLNVLPTAYPPSLSNPKLIDQDGSATGWKKTDPKWKKKRAKVDMARIMQQTRRQIGKPELAETASLSYTNPYPDALL